MVRHTVIREPPFTVAPSARLAAPPTADLRCIQHGFVMTDRPSTALPSSDGGGQLAVGVALAHPTSTSGAAAVPT